MAPLDVVAEAAGDCEVNAADGVGDLVPVGGAIAVEEASADCEVKAAGGVGDALRFEDTATGWAPVEAVAD